MFDPFPIPYHTDSGGGQFNTFNWFHKIQQVSKHWASANHEVCTAWHAVSQSDDVGGFEYQHLKEAARCESLRSCRWHDMSEENGLCFTGAFFAQMVNHCNTGIRRRLCMMQQKQGHENRKF
jgi:hypothetical protein